MKKKAVAIWTAILLCVTLVAAVFAACTEDNATAIELEVDTSYKIEQPLEGAVFSTEDDNIAGVSEDGYIVICSAIDNLQKGAAAQAVQTLNLHFDFNENTALI